MHRLTFSTWIGLGWCLTLLLGVPVAGQDALTRQIRKMAAGTVEEYATAVRETIRLRNWTELDLLLSGNRVSSLDATTQRKLAQEIGGPLLSRASSEATLGEAATEALVKLTEALASSAQDGALLDEGMAQLRSPEMKTQAQGARKLLGGGDEGLARVLGEAVSATPTIPTARLVDVLTVFGPSAMSQTEELVFQGSSDAIPRALTLLSMLSQKRALRVAAAMYHDPGSSVEVREVARQIVTGQWGAIPTAEEVLQWLTAELRQGRVADPSSAASLARLASRIPGAAHQSRVVFAKAVLRDAYLRDPQLGIMETWEKMEQTLGIGTIDGELLLAVLDESLAGGVLTAKPPGDAAAAVMAVRMLGNFRDPAILLFSTPAPETPSPLVLATSSHNPRLRYEAAAAIAKLGPREPYAGSQRVFDRWIEMSQLEGDGKAIVWVPEKELQIAVVTKLEKLGMAPVLVSHGAELLREVDSCGDLQGVIVTSTPADSSVVEVVDRVRRRPFGGMVPIVVLGAPVASADLLGNRWSVPAHFLEVDLDQVSQRSGEVAEQLQRVLDEERAGMEIPPISSAERVQYARDGWAALGALAERPELEPLYEWRERGDELIEVSRRSGYTPSILQVLSQLGTPASQEVLTLVLASPSFEAGIRRTAGEAFTSSVQQFGTRLSRTQVVALYDQVNSTKEELSRELLGKAIDAIEARVGITRQP